MRFDEGVGFLGIGPRSKKQVLAGSQKGLQGNGDARQMMGFARFSIKHLYTVR